MKRIAFAVTALIMIGNSALAQKYLTRTGKISFNASSPSSPEKIEAVNNQVASVLDAQTGKLIFQVLIKSFKFERELMEEHFNENYMESDKYDKATFEGAISNPSDVNFGKDGTYTAQVAGKLTIHGVSHDVSERGTVTVTGGSVNLKARFIVKLGDYKISIPSVVADKVAKDAAIVLDCDLSKK